MELTIFTPQENDFPKVIKWNNEEIKKEVADKVSFYKNLVYDDTQIKAAKTDRATLNKFVKALEGKKREIREQCLAPYTEFAKQVDEIIAIVNEPVKMIDGQVKDYENKQKADKKKRLQKYFEDSHYPKEITFDKIYNERWLNVTYKEDDIKKEIDDKKAEIENNLATLKGLPEYGFESSKLYLETLDMTRAINEGKRLSDMQKQKEAYLKAKAEQERAAQERAEQARAEQERVAAAEPVQTPIQEKAPTKVSEAPQAVEKPEESMWVNFSAKLTVTQARELKQFCADNNIEIKPIQ